MDPLTIGGIGMTLSTLTGLVALWKGEQRERDKATLDQFIEWLRRHNHEQVVNLIQDNAELTRTLRGLVEGQHERVMAGLASLESLMIDVAGRLDQFSPIVQALGAESKLSPQAVSILKQMNDAGAISVFQMRYQDKLSLYFTDKSITEPLKLPEQRFVDDDLDLLVDLHLLLPDFSGNSTKYRITRAGSYVGEHAG